MSISEIIGKNIKLCLKEKDVDMIEYAKLIRVTRQTVSNYINGSSTINAEQLLLTAKYFNKTLDWFYKEVHKQPVYTEKDIADAINENVKLRALADYLKVEFKVLGDRIEKTL